MLRVAVDIRRWLHIDRQTPHAERLQRDVAIGRQLPSGASPEDRLLGWWEQVDPNEVVSVGDRLERLRRLATVVLVLLGMLLGGGLAGVAFGYEGIYPVNLFALLAVLVGVPTVLLLLTLLLLPGHLPGMGALQDVVAGMNVGRWVGAWLDRFTQTDIFQVTPGGYSTSAFARWQLVVFSQWLAIGFFAGVLSVAWLLVVFTDLAFGWSTTLQVEAASVYGLFSAIALPWSSWLASATPDATLVEASRFYRLDGGDIPIERASRLGDWWPFVLMTVLVYGLLPRLVLVTVATWRLKVSTRLLLTDDPEITALIDRLTLPQVDYLREGEDIFLEAETALSTPPAATAIAVDDGATFVLIWNGALTENAATEWLASSLGIRGKEAIATGALDGQALHRNQLQKVPDDVHRLVIFTKGWEPPLLEFLDFLKLTREVVGSAASLILVPIDVTGKRVLASERKIWAQALAGRGDSALYAVAADDLQVGET